MVARHFNRIAGVLAAAALLVGCRDDFLIGFDHESVAITAGDFDNCAVPLDRMEIGHETYEGIISTATWDPTYDYESVALKVEGLLPDAHEMTPAKFSVVFIASGTRGLGQREYNSLEPDDQLVSDDTVIENVQRYVDDRGVLVVTDWGYDLVEAAWPDEVGFLGDDSTYDDAQRGEIGSVAGRIVDDEVVDMVGFSDMAVHYNYSNWAVIDEVDSDVRVIVRGSIRYTPEGGEETTLEDAPLMVVFQPQGAQGKVVLTTFHLNAQGAGVIDPLLLATVGSFSTSGGGTVAID
jgi:hypothetical protein